MNHPLTTLRPWTLSALAVASLICAPAYAANGAQSGKDHPLVGHYEGATLQDYRHSDFDEAYLLKGKYQKEDHASPEWLKLEGKITEIRYLVPAGRSPLEVFRNHETALKAKGFETVFACADNECTAEEDDLEAMGDAIDRLGSNPNGRLYSDHARYGLFKSGGNYVTILAGVHGSDEAQPRVFVEVVETKAMETDKIRVPTADEIAAAIASSGKIALYGILFDFDKAVVKSESKPQLDQIAALLKKDTALKLVVTGHTDNKGTAAYNLDLSKRRAEAVVAALTGEYGIAASRLQAQGKGSAEPLSGNDTEEGRAKNRRVELSKP